MPRFGFHSGSSIDALLDREDVNVEALLDDDELLQECKAQNTRLSDYFQRKEVLLRLLGYVSGEVFIHDDEDEDVRSNKYPYIATEVLCSEIWSIVETCLNNAEQLLSPFWDAVLSKSFEELQAYPTRMSHFVKINALFLSKKSREMLTFIQSQPSVIERFLRHIENPPVVEFIVRLMQYDDHPDGAGVLEWLSSQRLVPRLLSLLSPDASSVDIHSVVCDLAKTILTMAVPSPGAANFSVDDLQLPVTSTLLARDFLVQENVQRLISLLFPPDSALAGESSSEKQNNVDEGEEKDGRRSSSVSHTISIVIEIIRKGNPDYFEPYLFHTLRTRSVQLRQDPSFLQSDDPRREMETRLEHMTTRLGILNVGCLLEALCGPLENHVRRLVTASDKKSTVHTTYGDLSPLTQENLKICELLAEILHCTNLSALNRSHPQFDDLYDQHGTLRGGLNGLRTLGEVISCGASDSLPDFSPGRNGVDDGLSSQRPTSSLTSSMSTDLLSGVYESSDEGLQSKDDKNPSVASEPKGPPTPRFQETDTERAAQNSVPTPLARQSQEDVPIGDELKNRFLKLNVIDILLDLFFAYPWNNFLHAVVYDFVNQILSCPSSSPTGRALIVSLFHDARLINRILDVQQLSQQSSSKPKGIRLGSMGHITLIVADVIGALEHYPEDLRLELDPDIPRPQWSEYVDGPYAETHKKDTSLLGGGRPLRTSTPGLGIMGWGKVDETSSLDSNERSTNTLFSSSNNSATGHVRGEFRRHSGATSSTASRNTADFGPTEAFDDSNDDSEDNPSQFARYLTQEVRGAERLSSSTSSDASDEEEENGWLSHSTFELGRPPATSRRDDEDERSCHVFDDSFASSRTLSASEFDAEFLSSRHTEDDQSDPFSDHTASGSEPFTFSFSSNEEDENVEFDEFGEFGDFQSAEDGAATPTAESWTLPGPNDMSSSSGENSEIFRAES